MTKEIHLSNGETTLVDDDVYEWASKFRWHYSWGYAARSVWNTEEKKRVTEYLHKLILNLPPGIEGDHINKNKLDNRRENLRPATRSQNVANRSMFRNNKSGYIGVYWNKALSKWHAQVRHNGKLLHVGLFGCPKAAAKARDAKAKQMHGEYATLNFK